MVSNLDKKWVQFFLQIILLIETLSYCLLVIKSKYHHLTFVLFINSSPRPPREARCEGTNLDVRGVLLHAW